MPKNILQGCPYSYLITQQDMEPAFTNWFSLENMYVEGMIVYNLDNGTYYDGKKDEDGITEWKAIQEDHL